MATLKSRLVPRNGTAEAWTAANPVLLKGELGIEIDTGRFKFGDGLTSWSDLPYSDQGVRDLIASLETSLTSDLADLQAVIQGGATLAEAKAALQALGTNYQDLFSVASTLKSFLEDSDTADATINKWKEIEEFLQGIEDTESLTGLLSALEQKITDAYTQAIDEKLAAQFEDDVFVLDGGSPEGWE